MNKENTVNEWRHYFEKSDNDSTTYKLFLETAYGCHGSCLGCPIPLDLRDSKEPKWQLGELENNLDIFAENLVSWRNITGQKPIENLALTVGPAENLYFSAQYLKNLALISKKFKEKIQAKHFHLAVSTAGLFSEEKLIDKIEALKSVLNENELTFAFIINLRQFEKTPEHYFRFARFIFEHVNLVELEINLDQDVGQISKESLIKFSQFVNSFPFIQLDFAYAINDGNMIRTYLKNDQFYDFIQTTRELSNSSVKRFFSQQHERLNPVASMEFDFYNNFNEIFNSITQKSIRLNALGEWHFAKNILGTIYYDENFGFSPLSNFKENPFLEDNLKRFKKELLSYFNKQLINHEPCSACQWKNICLSSGFLTYSKFSPSEENICTNPAFTIFNNHE